MKRYYNSLLVAYKRHSDVIDKVTTTDEERTCCKTKDTTIIRKSR